MEIRPFRNTGYTVSDAGDVYSPSGRKLKPRPNQQGYLRVTIKGRDEYIHRMVLTAFRGEAPSRDHEGDHRNKKRDDCRLDNLQWLLKKSNLEHRTIHRGEANYKAILNQQQVDEIRRGPFYRGRDRVLAEAIGVCRELVRDVRLLKCWPQTGESQ